MTFHHDQANPNRPPTEPPALQAGCSLAPEVFGRIAQMLDLKRRTPNLSMRKDQRQRVMAPCQLSYYGGPSQRLQTQEAFIRNLSSGGAAVLLTRPMVRGDLVELFIDLEDSPVHLAGHVAFCRPVEWPVHDLGLQIFHQATLPILPIDGKASVGPVGDWLQRVIEAHGTDQRRRSA
jgi:hypothetical protein